MVNSLCLVFLSRALQRKIFSSILGFGIDASVLSHLNVDQWVMARDRHRLNRLTQR